MKFSKVTLFTAASILLGGVGVAGAQTSTQSDSGNRSSQAQGKCWDAAMNRVRSSGDVTGSVSSGNSTDNPEGSTDPAMSSNTGAGAGGGNSEEIPSESGTAGSGSTTAASSGSADATNSNTGAGAAGGNAEEIPPASGTSGSDVASATSAEAGSSAAGSAGADTNRPAEAQNLPDC